MPNRRGDLRCRRVMRWGKQHLSGRRQKALKHRMPTGGWCVRHRRVVRAREAEADALAVGVAAFVEAREGLALAARAVVGPARPLPQVERLRHGRCAKTWQKALDEDEGVYSCIDSSGVPAAVEGHSCWLRVGKDLAEAWIKILVPIHELKAEGLTMQGSSYGTFVVVKSLNSAESNRIDKICITKTSNN